jgi:hypothetical protein
MAEYERILQAAMTKHAKGASNETLQKSIVLSMLKKRGRISYGESGTDFDWRIKYRQIVLEGTSDMEAYSFQRHNLYKKFTLDWRGARIGDIISEKEKLMCRGAEQIINLWGQKADVLKEDAQDQLNKWMFYDGNATGYTKNFHGLASILAYTTLTTNTSQYATGVDSYGGQTLSAVHGTESDATAYTPFHLNEAYTDYSSWASNPTKVMRALISGCTVKNEPGGKPDVAMTTEARYIQFKDKLASEEQYTVSGSEIKSLAAGFDAVRYDGVELTWDYDYNCTGGLGATTACWNFSKCKLRMLTSQLFEGMTSFDHDRRAYLFDLVSWGNLEFNPRYFGWAGAFKTAFGSL